MCLRTRSLVRSGVTGGRQDLLLCKRRGESVGICESLRRSETPLQRPPNETRGGRSEGESVWDAGEQVVEISFITEDDVYRLIVHSKLPSAERFEHWVFDEVLPSIRKHGVYMSDSILDQVIQHPEVIYTLAKKLEAEREQLEGMLSKRSIRVFNSRQGSAENSREGTSFPRFFPVVRTIVKSLQYTT